MLKIISVVLLAVNTSGGQPTVLEKASNFDGTAMERCGKSIEAQSALAGFRLFCIPIYNKDEE